MFCDPSFFDKGIPKQNTKKNENDHDHTPEQKFLSIIESSQVGEPPKIPQLVDGLLEFRKTHSFCNVFWKIELNKMNTTLH